MTNSVGIVYVLYMCYLDPLTQYPGSLLENLTNLWKPYTMRQGQIEYVIRDQDGIIIRIGPNDLVISHPDAVGQSLSLETHSNRFTFNLLKFNLVDNIYDGFEAVRQIVFGTQSESVLPSWSTIIISMLQDLILQMEGYLDGCLSQLINPWINILEMARLLI